MSDRSLSKAEMSALLESAKRSPRDYSLLAFARLTGLRVSELVRVRFEDLSPSGTLRVNTAKQKQPVVDEIPVRPAVLELVAWWSKECGRSTGWMWPGETDGHLCRRAAQEVFRKHARLAGVDISPRAPGERGLGIHALRHCFACELVEAGYSEIEVMGLLRDRSLSAAAVYMGSRQEDAAVERAGYICAQVDGESYGVEFLRPEEVRPRFRVQAVS